MDDAERAFRDALHRVDSVKIPVPSLEPTQVRRRPGLGIMTAGWLAAAAVLALVAGLAVWALAPRGQAVTAIPVAPPTVASAVKLTGTTWIAVEFHGKPTEFAADKMPFLEFRADSTFGGADPCNVIGGTYQLAGDQLAITRAGGSRQAGCNPPQQHTFLSVLEDTRRVSRDGDVIELLDQAGSVLARFRSSEAYTEPGPIPTPTPTNPPTVKATPSIGPAPSIWVRIRNASNIDFTDVYVVFPTGKKVHYGPITAGSASKYELVLKAYRYSYVKVTTARKSYVYQPVDYVGESELPNGHYGYTLDIVDARLDLTLEVGK